MDGIGVERTGQEWLGIEDGSGVDWTGKERTGKERIGLVSRKGKDSLPQKAMMDFVPNKHELRKADLLRFERGDIISPEVFEQDHWTGVKLKDDPVQYCSRLQGFLKWIEKQFLNRGLSVVCKQTNYGVELLYGAAALEYINERIASAKRTMIKVGDKLETHIARRDLTPTQIQRLESAQSRHALVKAHVTLAEAKASIQEAEKQGVTNKQMVSIHTSR